MLNKIYRGTPEWRAVRAKRARDYYKTKSGRKHILAYEVRSGRVRNPITVLFSKIISDIFHSCLNRRLKVERQIRSTEKEWSDTRKLEEGTERRYQAAFFNKIWQPCICFDCGVSFETLHPIEWIALGIKCSHGTKRCSPCRKNKWNSNHGGDYRRCKKFDVPYDNGINRIAVLERDNWICYRCGISTPKEKRGTYETDAPEVDHVWALAEIRNGQKSPGHVDSNLRCICRKCNTEKNKEVNKREPGSHDVFHKQRMARLEGWLNGRKNWGDRYTKIICAECGKQETRKRVNAKYCSERCQRKARIRKRKPSRFPFYQKIFNNVCCKVCGESFQTLYAPINFLGIRLDGVEHCKVCRIEKEKATRHRQYVQRHGREPGPIGRPRKQQLGVT